MVNLYCKLSGWRLPINNFQMFIDPTDWKIRNENQRNCPEHTVSTLERHRGRVLWLIDYGVHRLQLLDYSGSCLPGIERHWKLGNLKHTLTTILHEITASSNGHWSAYIDQRFYLFKNTCLHSFRRSSMIILSVQNNLYETICIIVTGDSFSWPTDTTQWVAMESTERIPSGKWKLGSWTCTRSPNLARYQCCPVAFVSNRPSVPWLLEDPSQKPRRATGFAHLN